MKTRQSAPDWKLCIRALRHALHLGTDGNAAGKANTRNTRNPIVLTLTKITPREEFKLGADLELIIDTPLGAKKALMQAKVVDQAALSLRLYSAKEWQKLRTQLKDIRASAGALSYLLAYVPGSQLDGGAHGYSTWEQQFLSTTLAGHSSIYGATLIPVDELLTATGRWKHRPAIQYLAGGKFKPEGLSFTRALLEIICCWRGDWDRLPEGPVDGGRARSTLMAVVSQVSLEDWSELVRYIRRTLEAQSVEG